MLSRVANSKKGQRLYWVLSGVFITHALLAEMVGAKIFSLEATLGLSPFQLPLGQRRLDFDLTAGVLLWPVVFVMTDVINEYFGLRGVRRLSFFTAGLMLYAFVIFYLVSMLPPADFWLKLYEDKLDIDEAFSLLFRQGMGIITGSLLAFLVSQLLDVIIFQKIRQWTGSRRIWLRATGSTLISQLIDSFVVLWVAFYLFPRSELRWELAQILAVGSLNYVYKFVVALASTPLIYFAHHVIDQYLGEKTGRNVVE